MNDPIEDGILQKILSNNGSIQTVIGGLNTIYYRRLGNWSYKISMEKEPEFWVAGKLESASTISELKVQAHYSSSVISIINSTLFYWWWILISNEMDLKPQHIGSFPIALETISSTHRSKLNELSKELYIDLYKNAELATYNKKRGETIFYRFFPFKSKHILDKIDLVLGEHFHFTPEEFDFITNYDYKYRTGRDSGEGEDD